MTVKNFPIEAGHIMMFARAIGDPNPIYGNEAHAQTTEPGTLIPPPTFYQASAQFDPDWYLRPKIGEPWFGSGKNPTGISQSSDETGDALGGGSGRGLHAEQHFEYHQPVRVGDTLRTDVKPGNKWQKQGRRGGKLIFSETITEYRNQHDTLVVTARAIMVVTEKAPG